MCGPYSSVPNKQGGVGGGEGGISGEGRGRGPILSKI